MVYFSLATLGYGGIFPSSPFTQMLAVLEAVIGQFFMAVLVAWLVGMSIYDNGQMSGRFNRLVQYWLNARTRFALRLS
jgi:Ion channel